MPQFTDETIARMFGAEDAENETPERLKEYFYRNKAYDSLRAILPIRLLVGFKGVGKSALLKVSYLEDAEADVLALWVRPNDVFGSVDSSPANFLQLIENWKAGLSTLIVRKALEGCGDFDEAGRINKITGGVRQITSTLYKRFESLLSSSGQDSMKVAKKFLLEKRIRIYLDDLDRGWEGGGF